MKAKVKKKQETKVVFWCGCYTEGKKEYFCKTHREMDNNSQVNEEGW